MNAKRQTIWLVSMLSLMVVLSAYYLFTEDVNKLNTATDKAAQEDIKVSTEVKDPQAGTQAVSGGLASSTSTGDAKSKDSADSKSKDSSVSKSKDSTGGDSKASADAKAAQGQTSSDAQILDKLQNGASSGADYFAAMALKRNQDFQEQMEQLLNTTADTSKSTDEITKAHDQYEQMQTMQAKVENLEDLLMKTYKSAIVLTEGSKYKAVVETDKLDTKQAQKIIDMMIKELNVTKDSVSVQYIN